MGASGPGGEAAAGRGHPARGWACRAPRTGIPTQGLLAVVLRRGREGVCECTCVHPRVCTCASTCALCSAWVRACVMCMLHICASLDTGVCTQVNSCLCACVCLASVRACVCMACTCVQGRSGYCVACACRILSLHMCVCVQVTYACTVGVCMCTCAVQCVYSVLERERVQASTRGTYTCSGVRVLTRALGRANFSASGTMQQQRGPWPGLAVGGRTVVGCMGWAWLPCRGGHLPWARPASPRSPGPDAAHSSVHVPAPRRPGCFWDLGSEVILVVLTAAASRGLPLCLKQRI